MTARQFDGGGGIQRPAAGAARAGKGAAVATPVPRLLLTDEEAGLAWGMSARKFRETADELGIKPVVLGPRMVRWPVADLQAAIEHMPRQESKAEPESLVRARIARLKGEGNAQ